MLDNPAAGSPWPFPRAYMAYFTCTVKQIGAFKPEPQANGAVERRFFNKHDALELEKIRYHEALFRAALTQATLHLASKRQPQQTRQVRAVEPHAKSSSNSKVAQRQECDSDSEGGLAAEEVPADCCRVCYQACILGADMGCEVLLHLALCVFFVAAFWYLALFV